MVNQSKRPGKKAACASERLQPSQIKLTLVKLIFQRSQRKAADPKFMERY